MHETLTIGELARRTGCKVVTIRYYEQLGLLNAPVRTQGGHRTYTRTEEERLRFICRGRSLGFSLAAVSSLLNLLEDRQADCGAIDELASRNLETVRAKIADLRQIEAQLEASLRTCRNTTRAHCAVAEALTATGEPGRASHSA